MTPARRPAGRFRLEQIHQTGARLAVETAGTGPPLLYVHGFPLDRSMWRDVIERLDGWHHIVPDLRGFGASVAPADGYAMACYADDLVGLLDHMAVDAAVVCGLSMGGYVAFEMMRRHPARVRGLVLANTRAEPDPPEGKRARDAMAELVEAQGTAALAEQLVPKLLSAESRRDKPELVERLRAMIAQAPRAGILGALGAMKARADSRPLLPRLRVPALVIAGTEDALIPEEDARSLAVAIPGGRLVMIRGAGHLTPMEQPGLTARAIDEFLRML